MGKEKKVKQSIHCSIYHLNSKNQRATEDEDIKSALEFSDQTNLSRA